MFREARQIVLDACHELADIGFLPGTGGNVAFRASSDVIAITPSACDYYTMDVDDICLVELATSKQVFGQRRPSVELGIHSRLLTYRQDFHASIHTHQPVASAITLLQRSLPIDDADDRAQLGSVAPLIGYAPSGTGFLARAFGKGLRGEASAYLLKNHGIVCGGASMPQAIANVGRLERAAKRYLLARLTPGLSSQIRDLVVRSLSS
jgi:L-fuculose-phosphate aldolase